MSDNDAPELYRRHRPKLLKDFHGNSQAKNVLLDLIKGKRIPHAILFTGPSGCGKTTLARIMVGKLKCQDTDFTEVNAADDNGIGDIRIMRAGMGRAPMGGNCRVYLIDEAHALTGGAQSVLLKMLEDCPRHVYFMLCTTDPQKLKKTVHTRCTEVKVCALGQDELCKLMAAIIQKEMTEGEYPPDDVLERIAEVSDGSARKALVILDQVRGIQDPADQMKAVENSDVRSAAFDLVKALIWQRKGWKEVTAILKTLDEEAEGVRRMILTIAAGELVKDNKFAGRAFVLLDVFQTNYYDCGKAGLVRDCYAAFHEKG